MISKILESSHIVDEIEIQILIHHLTNYEERVFVRNNIHKGLIILSGPKLQIYHAKLKGPGLFLVSNQWAIREKFKFHNKVSVKRIEGSGPTLLYQRSKVRKLECLTLDHLFEPLLVFYTD